jgi:hypothetical protein
VADLSLNGAAVQHGTLRLPRIGAWTAEVVVDVATAPSGAVTLATGDGRYSLRGTVVRSGVDGERAHVRIVGGAGGLWRVADDGTVWIGEETWPAASAADVDLVAEEPTHARVTVGAASLPLGIRPGTVYNGQRVSYVEHTFDADAARAEVWFEREGATADRWGVALDALVRHTMRGVQWHARFPARVVGQNADGTLDLDPDDDRLPDLVAVPLRLFLPGVTARVVAGARVLVGFEAGDPRRPIAELFESGALSELTIATQGGATLRLMSSGDVHVLPGGLGTVMLGTTNPANQRPVAGGGDAVASAAVTPIPSRRVMVPSA